MEVPPSWLEALTQEMQSQVAVRRTGSQARQTGVILPSTGCVSLDESPNFFEPQFPFLSSWTFSSIRAVTLYFFITATLFGGKLFDVVQ